MVIYSMGYYRYFPRLSWSDMGRPYKNCGQPLKKKFQMFFYQYFQNFNLDFRLALILKLQLKQTLSNGNQVFSIQLRNVTELGLVHILLIFKVRRFAWYSSTVSDMATFCKNAKALSLSWRVPFAIVENHLTEAWFR